TINNNLKALNKLWHERSDTVNKRVLSDANIQNIDNTNTSSRSNVQSLINATLSAIGELERIEAKLNLRALDLEKAYSNLIKSMIDFGLYREAVQPLLKLRMRLLNYFGACNGSKNPSRSSDAIQNITRPPMKYKIGRESKNIDSSDCLFNLFSFHIPDNNKTENNEAKLLVLSSLVYAYRCSMELEEMQFIKRLPEILKKNDSRNPIILCQSLKNTDTKSVNMYAEMLMRIISKACVKLQGLSEPILILRLRAASSKLFLMTARFDLANLFEYALGSAVNDRAKVISSYENVVNLLSERVKSEEPHNYLADILRIVALKINIFSLVLEELSYMTKYFDILPKLKQLQQDFRNIIAPVLSNVQKAELSKEEICAKSQLFKAAELLRRAWSKIVEFMEDASKNKSIDLSIIGKSSFMKEMLQQFNSQKQLIYEESKVTRICTAIKETIEEIALCLDTICISFHKYKSPFSHKDSDYLDPEKASLIAIGLYEDLSRFTLAFYKTSSLKKCICYIEKALQIAHKTSCIEGFFWISNSYYRIGIFYHNNNQVQLAIEPLQHACTILDQYVCKMQQISDVTSKNMETVQAHLSKRYEALGACWNILGEIKGYFSKEMRSCKNARISFEKSLRSFPKKDLIQLSVLVSTQGIFSAFQQAPVISKLIERYIKLSFADDLDIDISLPHEFLLMDDIKLAGLMEYELRVLKAFEDKLNGSKVETLLIEKLLSLYYREEFPIRRARVLIEKFKVMSYKEINMQMTAMALAEEAIELLKSDDTGQDASLLHLRPHYLAIAYSWIGILMLESGKQAIDSFKRALIIWKSILANIPLCFNGADVSQYDIENTKKNIDDVERLYGHLQSVTLYIQIGKIYLNLGYTGKAGLAFSQAKVILDSHRCDDDVNLSWMLGYSHYLCAIGNMNKRIIQNDARHRKHEQLLIADAHLTRSYISIRLGILEDAIICCTEAVRLLNRLMKSINRSSRCLKQQMNAAINPFLVDDKTTTEGSSLIKNGNQIGGFLTLSAQRLYWHVTHRFLECFNQLGRLHILRGCVKEADYFFKEALNLIEATKANSAMSLFLLNVAELEYRKHCWKESKEKLEKALEYQQKADIFQKEVALANLCIGDFKHREGDFKHRQGDSKFQEHCYRSALEYYQRANNILSDIMKKDYITKLESTDASSVFQTPTYKKFISYYPASPITKVTGDDAVQYECFLLSCMKSELFRRQGWLLSKQGNVSDGTKLIELSSYSNQPCLEKAEYLFVLSKAHIMNINDTLLNQNRLVFDNVRDSANKKRSQRAIKSKAEISPQLLQELDRVTEYLIEVYDLAYECGPTQLLQEASLCITMTNVIKSYGQDRNFDQSEVQTKCAYYLEMTRALTAKRQMIAKLNEKLRFSLTYDDMQWPKQIATSVCLDDKDCEDDLSDETESQKEFLKILLKQYTSELSLTYEQFQSEFLDILPHNWAACSISIDIETNDMYICRYQRKTSPLLLRLPLKRQSIREGDEGGFTYSDAIKEFNEILELSNQSMRTGKMLQTKHEKVEWWKERSQLDLRLKELLDNIEDCWLGGFKGILMANTHHDPSQISRFKDKMDSINFRRDVRKPSAKHQIKNKFDIDIELYKLLLRLGAYPKDQDIEDVLYFLVDAYNKHNDEQIGYDEIDWDKLTIDVREIISSINLVGSSQANDQHVILILDKNVQMLPWESLPCLRSQAVSRLPSLSFLRDRITLINHNNNKQCESKTANYIIDQRKAFYVLNPSQDLKYTQNEFEEWDGVIGRPPIEQECKNGLTNNDLYIYVGHGTGEQYFRSHRIRALDRCAVTLLLGCSSGHLCDEGEFDPSGTALSYIIAGCPALVANLWDVTDKDIDRFSKALFNKWKLCPNDINANDVKNHPSEITPREDVSLVQAVSMARNECKLKYLIGAAPVVYGIPCYLSHTRLEDA
ncbi:31231_t:CDS:10, partial [Gigaspora margarita]